MDFCPAIQKVAVVPLIPKLLPRGSILDVTSLDPFGHTPFLLPAEGKVVELAGIVFQELGPALAKI